MSQQKQGWLNKFTRIGFTAQRGNAWHWREGDTNHFEGAIPPQEIIDLFDQAHAVEADVFTNIPGTVQPFRIEDKKAIILPAMGNHVAGVHGKDFQIHQFKETLFDKMSALVNGVGFASAGLLDNGARAFCQLELPGNEEAAGFKFRVGLLGASALDGSLATLFKDTLVGVVCDNTLSAAVWGAGERIKVKHTRLSLDRLEDSGDAIMALKALAEKMGYAIETASKRVVTEAQFQAFLKALVPMTEEVPHSPSWGSKPSFTRGHTMAANKRNAIADLYHSDERAAPWAGSVLGVMQAVNTYNTHEATVRNAEHRAERFAGNLISGKVDILDALAMETLNKVLVAA